VFAALLAVASAQVVDFVSWPKSISDMAFNVTLQYSGFASVFSGDMGMIVSLNTDLGDYLSDGKVSLGSVGSGTAIVYIRPPLGFVNDNIGLNVTLRAFVIMYTDILKNVSTAYTYALKDQNLTGIPVSEASTFGSAGMLKFMGVNIGGGEIGAKYDSASTLYFKELGFNTFGLFTSWSRLVPVISTGNMKQSEVTALYNAVNYITNKVGGFCVLELHDYGRYSTDAIGNGVATQDAFVSVWSKLGLLFKNNSRVIFSLMNEAHDQNTSPYVSALNATIAALRGKSVGATNMIMIQGNRWNSAMNWLDVDEWGKANTETLVNVYDPIGNTIFNIHQYLDASHGGSFDGCISENIGSLYLSGITLWLRNNNRRAYLGEFGASNDDVCKKAVADIISYVEANSDVWVGWSWWNAGAFLSDTSYTIQPIGEEGNFTVDPKESWLTSHKGSKCPVFYSGAQSSKVSSCLLMNGFEGSISNDANTTTPTDDTGKNGTSKNPGKVVKLNPKAALSFSLNEKILAALMSLLLALSILI
jgi:endoglucanase